jgi:hypothetical protein
MTPEELNRTLEFTIEHQARARVQKRDRLWAKRMLARLDADIQEHAARMKWWEEFMREEREWRRGFEEAMQKRDQDAQKRYEDSLARLDRIIDKLSDRKN